MKTTKKTVVLAMTALILLSSTLTPQKVENRVLLEQFTGTWCGWCPFGHEVLNTMKMQYGDRLILLVYHSRDQLATKKGDELIKFLRPFYPSAVINRHKFPGSDRFHLSRADWQRTVEYQMGAKASLELNAENIKYDPKGRTISFNAKLFTKMPMKEKYRVNVILTEDHLLAKQKIYTKPYKELKDFYHSYVVREMITGTFGEAFAFNKKVIRPENRAKRQRERAEYSYSKNFSFKIDPKYKDKYCHVILFVHQDKENGFGPVLQAAEFSVSDLIPKKK